MKSIRMLFLSELLKTFFEYSNRWLFIVTEAADMEAEVEDTEAAATVVDILHHN